MSICVKNLFRGSLSSGRGSAGGSDRCGPLASLIALAMASALLSGCGGSDREEKPEGAAAGAKNGAAASADADADTDTDADADADPDSSDDLDDAMAHKLTEKEVQNYMGAFKALKELGALTDEQLGDDPSELRQLATAFSLPGKWNSTLKKYGFDTESYTEVQIAVVSALGALASEEMKAQLEKDREEQEKQMEQMKKVLSPEDFAEMEKGMKEARQGMLSMYEAVPKENIDLARKYRAQLEAVLK